VPSSPLRNWKSLFMAAPFFEGQGRPISLSAGSSGPGLD
jgi:hypothetical protein